LIDINLNMRFCGLPAYEAIHTNWRCNRCLCDCWSAVFTGSKLAQRNAGFRQL